MRISVQKVRLQGINVDKSAFYECVSQYQNMLVSARYDLYSNYYIPSPSEFDSASFFKALWADFSAYRKWMTCATTGEIMTDPKILDYATFRAKDENFTKIISLLKKHVVAESSLESLCSLAKLAKFGRKPVVQLKSRLAISNAVKDYGNPCMDSPAVMKCFERRPGTSIVSVDTRRFLIKELAKKVGVSEADIREHFKTNKGLFLSDMTIDEECVLISYLCDGRISADGDYGELLNKTIEEYYNDYFSTKTRDSDCEKFESLVFMSALDERCEEVKKARLKYADADLKEFYVTNDAVYFEVNTEVSGVVNEKPYSEFKLGVFAYDTITGKPLPACNNLYGVAGELISEQDMLANNYCTDASPITVHDFGYNGKTFVDAPIKYYLISDVHYYDKRDDNGMLSSPTLEPKIGVSLELPQLEESELFHKYGCYKKTRNGLLNMIRHRVVTSFDSEEYRMLIADLTFCLVLLDAGIQDYTKSKVYSWLDDDIYARACYDAELSFRKLRRV